MEIFKTLWGHPNGVIFFLQDDHTKYARLGRKITKGGQSEIFELIDSKW